MMMRKNILKGALVVAFCCVFAGFAKADNIHLCATQNAGSPTTDPCNSNNAMAFSGTTAYVYGNPTGLDTLYLAILQPASGDTGTFNSMNNLWTALSEAPNQNYPNLSSTISQDFIASGITATSFNATDISFGLWATSGQAVAVPVEPAGTFIFAFTETPNGKLGLVSPYSSSLGTTTQTTPPPPVPEPMSLLLFGSGFAVMLAKKALRKS
jgi:hypothetical protein